MIPEIKHYPATHFVSKNVETSFTALAQTVERTLIDLHKQPQIDFDALRYPVIQYLNTSGMPMKNGAIHVNIGMATKAPLRSEGFITSILPAGKYAALVHKGPYLTLVDTHAQLQEWVTRNGKEFQKEVVGGEVVWKSRLELYLKGAESSPDPGVWVTEVRYLLKEKSK